MSDSSGEFAILYQQAQQGSPEAQHVLCTRYGLDLWRFVRKRMRKELRCKLEAADLVQEVWSSFFAHSIHAYTFTESNQLLAFLLTMAQNKVADAHRHHLERQRSDVSREQPFDGSAAAPEAEVRHRGPTPYDAAAAKDEWQHLLKQQPTVYRQILELLRQGYTPPEVARQLGVGETTVRRALERATEMAAR